MEQMGAGMVARDGLADVGMDNRVNLHANMNRLLGDYFVGADALHGHGAAIDLGNDGIVLVVVEDANVAHLATGVCVKRRVIEDYISLFAGSERLNTLAVLYDGQHFTATGFRLAITFEDGLV